MAEPVNFEVQLPDRQTVRGNATVIEIDEHRNDDDKVKSWTITLKGKGKLRTGIVT